MIAVGSRKHAQLSERHAGPVSGPGHRICEKEKQQLWFAIIAAAMRTEKESTFDYCTMRFRVFAYRFLSDPAAPFSTLTVLTKKCLSLSPFQWSHLPGQ